MTASARLPGFLGIGAPRCGTTWLHGLLAAHPEVYVPTRRKEVGYFDRYYERGPDWYASFFPRPEAAARYRAIGEVTPEYLYAPRAAERIEELGSVQRLIVMLRSPVERTFSVYAMMRRDGSFEGSFEDFLEARPVVTERSAYADYLEPFLARFGRARLLVLVQERATREVAATRRALASFLGVEPAAFPEAPPEAANASYLPRAPGLYRLAARAASELRRRDLDGIVNAIGPARVRRLLGRRPSGPAPMRPETRARLNERFAPEIERLERRLAIDLSLWKAA